MVTIAPKTRRKKVISKLGLNVSTISMHKLYTLYLWAWAMCMANDDCLLKHLIYLRSFKCASNSTKPGFNYSSLKNGCKIVTMNVVTCIQFFVCKQDQVNPSISTVRHKRFAIQNLQEDANFSTKIIHSTRGTSETDLIRYKLVIFAIVSQHTRKNTHKVEMKTISTFPQRKFSDDKER